MLDGSTYPDYRYIKVNEVENMARQHKFAFRKQKLIKKYPEILDESMTEREMTHLLGYEPVWDCGLLRYIYTNPDELNKHETD